MGGWSVIRVCKHTQLIKVCVHASRSWNWAHKPGLQEGAPAINQASFPPYVILMNTKSLLLKDYTTIWTDSMQHNCYREKAGHNSLNHWGSYITNKNSTKQIKFMKHSKNADTITLNWKPTLLDLLLDWCLITVRQPLHSSIIRYMRLPLLCNRWYWGLQKTHWFCIPNKGLLDLFHVFIGSSRRWTWHSPCRRGPLYCRYACRAGWTLWRSL